MILYVTRLCFIIRYMVNHNLTYMRFIAKMLNHTSPSVAFREAVLVTTKITTET